jgi:hypothetical protein
MSSLGLMLQMSRSALNSAAEPVLPEPVPPEPEPPEPEPPEDGDGEDDGLPLA